MKYYFITSLGRECFVPIAGIKDARKKLSSYVADDLKRGKARYGRVTKIKTGKDSYRIVIGGTQGYHIYSQYNLVAL